MPEPNISPFRARCHLVATASSPDVHHLANQSRNGASYDRPGERRRGRIVLRARLAVTALAALALAAWLAGSASGTKQPKALTLTPIGTYATGVFFNGDVGAAEIPAYDWLTRRVYVVNAVQKRVDVLDIRNPAAPTKLTRLRRVRPRDAEQRGHAVRDPRRRGRGAGAHRPREGRLLHAGRNAPRDRSRSAPLPDMLTFSPNGRFLLVANEGEPGAVDPMGSVSIIDFHKWPQAGLGGHGGLHVVRRYDARPQHRHRRRQGSVGRPRARVHHGLRGLEARLGDAPGRERHRGDRRRRRKGHGAAGARLQGSRRGRQRPRRERPRQRDQPLHLAGPLRDVPARRDRVLPPPRPDVSGDRERRRLAGR